MNWNKVVKLIETPYVKYVNKCSDENIKAYYIYDFKNKCVYHLSNNKEKDVMLIDEYTNDRWIGYTVTNELEKNIKRAVEEYESG